MSYDEKSGQQAAHDVLPRPRKTQADPKAEITRLTAALANAHEQARAAGEALARSAEEIASLRRAKELAEAIAHDEFKLRLHMEGDRMLYDSTEKALHATILSLREQVGALQADQGVAESLRAEIARGLERERAAQFQIAALHESLEAARASIESLTAQCEALQRVPQERKRFFFEKKNQKTFTSLG